MPPILLIHGAWHGKWCFEEHFTGYLSEQGFDVHAIDLPEHGEKFRSKGKLRFKSIKQYVKAVADYAQTFDEAPIVVGHSMGGLVVQKYLETHWAPAGILLASVPMQGVWPITGKMLIKHPLKFLRANLTMSMWPLVSDPELAHQLFFSAETPQSQTATYHARLQDESYRAFLDMLFLNLPRPFKIKTPMLVLAAEDDEIFTVFHQQITAREYDTEAVVFPNMAHDMMLEPGWQSVADTMIEWIKQRF